MENYSAPSAKDSLYKTVFLALSLQRNFVSETGNKKYQTYLNGFLFFRDEIASWKKNRYLSPQTQVFVHQHCLFDLSVPFERNSIRVA